MVVETSEADAGLGGNVTHAGLVKAFDYEAMQCSL
jgi:hypothetical protein